MVRARSTPDDSGSSTRGASNCDGSTRTALVGLCLLAAALLWFALWRARSSEMSVAEPPREDSQSARSPIDLGASANVDRAALELSNVAVAPKTADDSSPSLDPQLALIRGRFVDRDGSPVAPVRLELGARRPQRDESDRVDTLDPRDEQHATNGDDGRFAIVVRPRAAREFVLDASCAHRCSMRWLFADLHIGERRDLGDVVLERGGTIVGCVVDAKGRAAVGRAWTIHARHPWPNLWIGREPIEAETACDPATGAFEFDDVLPGASRLDLDLAGTNRIVGPVIVVAPGETVRAELTCPIEELAARISVIATCAPFGSVDRQIDSVVAIGSGARFTANRPGASTQAFTFDDLAPGSYSVRIDDPQFAPFRLDDVERGSVIEAHLTGSASVRLEVVDAKSGARIDHFTLRTQLTDSNWQSIVAKLEPEPGTGLVRGLLPIRQTLIVGADGCADSFVQDVDLEPGEVRSIRVELSGGAKVSGTVLRADRTLATERVEVRLVRRQLILGRWPALLEDAEDELGSRSASVDPSSGAFAFEHVPPGNYLAQACGGASLHSSVEELDVADADVALELVVPAEAYLHGRLLAPDGADFDGVALSIVPADFPEVSKGVVTSLDWRQRLRVPANSDGTYATGPLPAGRAMVSLTLPHWCLPEGFEGAGGSAGGEVNLGSIELVAGRSNERDFDLSSSFPGSARIALNIAGRSAVGTVVELCTDRGTYLETNAGSVVEQAGSVRVRPVKPGDFVLLVRAVDTSWYWIDPTPLRIASGAETNVSAEIELVDGTFTAKFADGSIAFSPQHPYSLGVRFDGGVGSPTMHPLFDARGRTRMSVPRGRYLLYYWPPSANGPAQAKVPFEWPLASTTDDLVIPLASK